MNTAHVLSILYSLHELNKSFQALDFLQYAKKTEFGYRIEQNDSVIVMELRGCTYILAAWLPDREPPMEDIHLQWDTSDSIKQFLDEYLTFPSYLLTSNSLADDLEPLWLATTWWPEDGHTDAVDLPQHWVQWWWKFIMEESEDTVPIFKQAESCEIEDLLLS
jgi:hypothetical protein